jgi:hypothetical protein
MAVQGPFQVECSALFPYGVGVVSEVLPLSDFDKSTRDHRVQAVDADTGMPMWVVEVMDFDPAARDRMFKVKIAAEHQPVPPDAVAGTPVRPVVLDGLLVMPYLNDNGPRPKIAYSLRASGLSAPATSGRRSSASSSGSES